MELKHRIRALWYNGSVAERKLWQALHNPLYYPSLDYHFQRHVMIGDFWVDFLSVELKLAIILADNYSVSNQSIDLKASEKQRTAVLQYRGYLTIPLWQNDIVAHWSKLISYLNMVLTQRKQRLNSAMEGVKWI